MRSIRPFLLAAVLLKGCSNQAIYDNIIINARDRCIEKQEVSEQECIELTKKTYEEYERERNKMLNTD